MRTDFERLDSGAPPEAEEGGFLGLALLAVAVGAGTALLFAPAEGAETRKVVGRRLRGLRGGAEDALARVRHELKRRESRRWRERRTSALLGLAVGAGIAALLVPESGPDTRQRIARAIRRAEQETEEQVQRVAQEPEPAPAL